MGKPVTVILVAMIFLALPFAGCLEEEVAEKKKIDAEELIEVENPCSMPSGANYAVDDHNPGSWC